MNFLICFDKKFDNTFLRIIRRKLKTIITLDMNVLLVKKYGELVSNILQDKISYSRVLYYYINHFQVKKDKNGIRISINDNIPYDKKYNIGDILKLVEFGTLQLKPYPLITNSIKKLKKNLKRYYNRYSMFGWC